ncbi:MAG: tetratricopeptide repeat protein [Candidatus Heimdallarchaeota archaeon]
MEKEMDKIAKKIYHGKYAQAYKKLKSIVRDDSLTKKEKAEYYSLLSNVEKLTHRHKDALKSLNKAISNTPKSNVLMNLRTTLLKADIYLNLIRYNDSLKIIDEAEQLIYDNKKKLGDKLKKPEAYLNFVRGVAFRVKGYPNEAKPYLKKGISLYEQVGDKQGLARSLRNMGLALSDNGELDEAIEFYRKSYDASMSIDNKRDSIHPLAYIGFIYWKIGNLDEGIKYFNQRLELSSNIKYPYGIFSSKYHLGNLNFLKGNTEESIKLLNETIKICEKDGGQKFKGLSSMVLSMCYKELGDLEKADECLNIAHSIFKKMKFEQFITEVLILKGDLLIQQGKIDKALKILRKALMKFEELGNVYAIAQTQQYIGHAYMVQGNYDEALINLTKALDFFDKSLSLLPKIQCLHRIGWVHWQAGKLKKANDYLYRSFIQAKAINNLATVASSLLGLISINIELKKNEKALQYLAEMKKIDRNSKNKVIHMETKLAQAIIYKESKNERDHGRAEILFESIINEPTLFFPFSIIAILNFSELLLKNIKETNDENRLVKLKGVVTKLYHLARDQHLDSLLAESYWLQSQLALVERNPNAAQKYLKLANDLVIKKNLTKHIQEFSLRQTTLEEQMPEIMKFKKDEISISQLVDHLQLLESIKQITKDTAKDLHQTPRDSVIMKRIFEFK